MTSPSLIFTIDRVKDLYIIAALMFSGELKMSGVTLEQLNENVLELKKEVMTLKDYLREDFELADDVKRDIEESRRRPISEFVKHADVMKRYS